MLGDPQNLRSGSGSSKEYQCVLHETTLFLTLQIFAANYIADPPDTFSIPMIYYQDYPYTFIHCKVVNNHMVLHIGI